MSIPLPPTEPPIESPILAETEGQAPAKPFMRTIKSFVKRAGRTTTGQAKAFEDLGPKFLLPTSKMLLILKQHMHILRGLAA